MFTKIQDVPVNTTITFNYFSPKKNGEGNHAGLGLRKGSIIEHNTRNIEGHTLMLMEDGKYRQFNNKGIAMVQVVA